MSILTGSIVTKDENANRIIRLLAFHFNNVTNNEEHCLLASDSETNNMTSAFKVTNTSKDYGEYSWNNLDAQLYYSTISTVLNAVKKCKLLKNGNVPKKSKIQVESAVSAHGIILTYTGKVKAYNFTVSKRQKDNTYTFISIDGDDGTVIQLNLLTDVTKINGIINLIPQIPFVRTKYIDKTKIEDVVITNIDYC